MSDNDGTSTCARARSRDADSGIPRGARETLQRRSRHRHSRCSQHSGGIARDHSAVDQVRDEVRGVVIEGDKHSAEQYAITTRNTCFLVGCKEMAVVLLTFP